MKSTKNTKIFILSLALGVLLLPFAGFDIFAKAASQPATKDKVSSVSPVVQVVSAHITTQVLVKEAPAIASCATLVFSKNILMQGGQQVDLNQPASCFSMEFGAVLPSGALKVVLPSVSTARVVVRDLAATILPYRLASSGSSSAIPFNLVTEIYLSAIALWTLRKKMARLGSQILSFQLYRGALSLPQLQMLRC